MFIVSSIVQTLHMNMVLTDRYYENRFIKLPNKMFKLSSMAQSFVPQTKDYLIIIIIFSQIIRYLSCVSKANDVFLQKMFSSFI